MVSQKDIEGPILGKIGRRLNSKNPYFPDGVNVNFVQAIAKNKLFVRTFERGVGFTNACGTGMSASSLAMCLTHPELAEFDNTISVYNPGGLVKTIVHFEDFKYWIELIGNATFTHQIDLDEKDLHSLNFAQAQITATGEQKAYEKFIASLPHFNNVKAI